MNASGTALQGKHTVEASELYMAFELSEKNWKLALDDGVRSPSRYTVAAGDTAALLECIAKAKARCGLAPQASIGSCYEAGRDGFWLHRWLIAHGIDNIVVDSASIEVNRRARRAKTDRLDGDKLLAMLLGYVGGERRGGAVGAGAHAGARRRAAGAPGTGAPGARAHRSHQSDSFVARDAKSTGEVYWWAP